MSAPITRTEPRALRRLTGIARSPSLGQMKREGALKHFILAFLLAVLGYVLFYQGIEHWRTRRGPWQVTFATSAGAPGIVIAQPRLGLTNVEIRFSSESLHKPQARGDDPLSISLTPSEGERVPKAGEGAVHEFNARAGSGNSLPDTNAAGARATNSLDMGTRVPAIPSPPTTLTFGQLQQVPYEVPFGKCIFLDTTSLPGTVVLDLFGHEIELLPRALIIDRQERPWRSDTTIELTRNPAGSAATQPHAQ